MSPRPTKATTPAVEDVEDLLEIANDATEKILFHRKSADGGETYLGALEPAKLRGIGIREYTRTRWGGGNFKAKIRANTGQWGKSRSFTIEGDAITAKHDTSSDDRGERRGRRRRRESSLLEQILIPTAIAAGAALIKKMTDDPKTDPILLELIRRGGRGESIDPIEYQRALMTAEERGERRGRELGEMRAQLDAPAASETSGNGVVSAIQEATKAAVHIVDKIKGPAAPAVALERRVIRPPANGETTIQEPTAVTTSETADIAPGWMQPFVEYKNFLILAADHSVTANPTAGQVIEMCPDETWQKIVDAIAANRLEAYVFAAIPELRATPKREAFIRDLVRELATYIKDHPAAPDSEEAKG